MQFVTAIVLSTFLPSLVHAEPACSSGTNGSYKAILACAESRSPEIKSAELELRMSEAQVGAAGQWQNPEFAAETFRRSENNVKKEETDFSVGIPLEIGKISSRKAVAQGGQAVSEAKLFEARARVRTEVLVKLHRLRQLIHEQEIIDEAINTFSKLISQYAKRPGLAPEQQISASVYRLSKSDYDLKKMSNIDELAALESYFKVSTGLEIAQIRKSLPESVQKWPSVPDAQGGKESPSLRILKAELDTANAELSLAQSDSWPTITVGPSLKIENENGRSEKSWGANIGFPIPVFSLNSGSRAAASAGVAIGESKYEIGRRQQNLKRAELVKIYENSVKLLSETVSHQEIEKRHSDAERLFTRGVVPSALVIEAHRTSYDLEKSRHERELKALESLFGIYAIDGTILEVAL